MQKKIKRIHLDYGFGFPVKLMNVPMVKIRGNWTPNINYDLLAKVVLYELSYKNSRLTGNEIRYIRTYFEMTLKEFANRFNVTHPAVVKWEKFADKPTNMNWSTEKDIRIFIAVKLSGESNEIVELYNKLDEKFDLNSDEKIIIDTEILAA